MFILEINEAIKAIRVLCALLCEAIYPVVGLAYNLFIDLATFQLMTPTAVNEIYKRVTVILTIVMVFYIIFIFIKYIIQPDTMSDKEQGITKLPLKIITVVVLIAFVPNFFIYANKVQNALIKNEVISKIILQKKSTADTDYNSFGKVFAWNMLSLFYYEETPDLESECDAIPCKTVIDMNESSLFQNGKLSYMTLGINSSEKKAISIDNGSLNVGSEKADTPYIHFDGIWAVLVGGFIAYMLVLYCVDVGARVIQLIYLQIIAPIPIIGILSPKKDNIFSKWLKQCTTTYLDVFIRLAIIYLVMLIANIIISSDLNNNLKSSGIAIKIALVLGLLVFAKRVPKMLSELFPSQGSAGGNFGLKAGDRNLGRALGTALGIVTGTAVGASTGLAQGLRKANTVEGKGAKAFAKRMLVGTAGATVGTLRGGLGGFGRGAINGAAKSSNEGLGKLGKNLTTGIKNQIKSNQQYGNRVEAGYALRDQIGDRLRQATGMASRVEQLENQKAPLKRHQDQLSSLAKTNDAIREHAFKKAKDKGLASYAAYAAAEGRLKRLQEDKDVIASYGGETSAAYQSALQSAMTDMKKYKDQATNEYIDANSATDGKLQGLFAQRDQQLVDYNKYASDSEKIAGSRGSKGQPVTIMVNGTAVTKYIEDMDAVEFDEYIKQIANNEINALDRNINTLTAEQEAIKRTTSNSGIGGSNK